MGKASRTPGINGARFAWGLAVPFSLSRQPLLQVMSSACTHDPTDIRGKTSYRRRRIYKKQVCRICGWVREYSMPSWAHGEWDFGEWKPPEDFIKHIRPDRQPLLFGTR